MDSDFDSIYIVPRNVSYIKSRYEPDLHSDFHNIYPIFSAPIKGISGYKLVDEMGRLGYMGILHRFYDNIDDRIKDIHQLGKNNVNFGVAIGINHFDIEFDVATCAFDKGAKLICVDVANGYMASLADIAKKLRSYFGNNIALMAGNIVSREGAVFLRDAGYDFVRVGIGGGNLCTTRSVTGIGRNNLVALADCAQEDGINLVIDGGIRNSGDIVKAFVCGADFAMIGSILAHSHEAENDGIIYGMASKNNHVNNNKEIKSIEGREQIVTKEREYLADIMRQIEYGIRSAMTYLNIPHYALLRSVANQIENANTSPTEIIYE